MFFFCFLEKERRPIMMAIVENWFSDRYHRTFFCIKCGKFFHFDPQQEKNCWERPFFRGGLMCVLEPQCPCGEKELRERTEEIHFIQSGPYRLLAAMCYIWFTPFSTLSNGYATSGSLAHHFLPRPASPAIGR